MAESGRKGGEGERIRTARRTPTGGVMHESRERKGKKAGGDGGNGDVAYSLKSVLAYT